MDTTAINIWLGIIAVATLSQAVVIVVGGLLLLRRVERAEAALDAWVREATPVIGRVRLALDDLADLSAGPTISSRRPSTRYQSASTTRRPWSSRDSGRRSAWCEAWRQRGGPSARAVPPAAIGRTPWPSHDSSTKEGHMGNGTTFVVGLACGMVAGAAVALLCAPMSGEETRRNLRRSADRLSRQAKTLYNGASDAAADLAAGGAELVDQLKEASARMKAARPEGRA